jgi:hypothetical protein
VQVSSDSVIHVSMTLLCIYIYPCCKPVRAPNLSQWARRTQAGSDVRLPCPDRNRTYSTPAGKLAGVGCELTTVSYCTRRPASCSRASCGIHARTKGTTASGTVEPRPGGLHSPHQPWALMSSASLFSPGLALGRHWILGSPASLLVEAETRP